MVKTVQQLNVIPQANMGAGRPAGPREPATRRGRRVIMLLLLACMLNAFDLIFTLLACRHQYFIEFNPFARRLIATPSTLVAFKVSFVGLGSLVMFRFRSHQLAEIGCWGVCTFYSILAAVWWRFYQLVG